MAVFTRNCLSFFNGLRSKDGISSDSLLQSDLQAELAAEASAFEESVIQTLDEETEYLEEQAQSIVDSLLTGKGLKWMFGMYWSIFSFLWFLVLLIDCRQLWRASGFDFSGTYAIIVAPQMSCHLSRGEPWVDLYPGASISFPPSDPQAPATCWKAGSLALALMDIGLNGTLLFRDTLLSETLPRAILKAESSESHKRIAVITFDHVFSQNLVQRPWMANLLGVQPPDVYWVSIGNDLVRDSLARDINCGNRSECGCSDPHFAYIDCLSGVFDLATLALHETTDELHRTIQAAQLTEPHELPVVGFASDIVAGVFESDHLASSREIRVLVDCGRRLAHLPNKEPEDLLDILFAGVYRFRGNYSENRTIVTTLLNCEDDRATSVELEKLSHAEFLHMISSSDVYTSVDAAPGRHVAGVAEAQVMGVPILSLAGIVAPELFQEDITGFVVADPLDVQYALEKIEQRMSNTQWRNRIHDWAQQRFSARKATEEILSQVLRLPMHDTVTISE